MSNRWPGGIISPIAPVPSGDGPGDSAPGIWTLEQAAPYIASGNWPGTGIPDPQFQYVTALLHGDGTNGGQNNTFLDSSSNNSTITRNGNTTQGSFSPYGNLWSNFFTTNNYLTAPANAAFQMGSGDFTIEAWIFPTATAGSSNSEVISYGAPNEFDGWHFYQVASTNVLSFGLNYAGLIVSSSAALPLNTWTHVAVTRSGTTFKLWINGVNDGTATSSTSQSTNASDKLYVGTGSYSQGADRSFIGYISNARVIKGSAIYSATFTPSTTPLTAISGTSVLTCQSNRFIDNSSNAFAITVTGSPSVQRFSPFQNLATYSAATFGASGFFDGTGDFLSSTGVPINFGTGAYTVEGWFYCTNTVSATSGVVSSGTNAGAYGFGFYILANARFIFYEGNNSDGASLNFFTTMADYQNQWVYFACVDDGSTRSMYLNGVRVATTSTGRSLNATTLVVGRYTADTSGSEFPGYISNIRISNIARYTDATMPVPTAQLTADTNTVYFAKMENAAIFDSDATNNFETVGNAQISTSVVKFGTGSMAFDGSGDYLVAPSIPVTAINGNFTIEGWAYRNTADANFRFFTLGDSIGSSGIEVYVSSGNWVVYSNNATRITGGSATKQVWTHLALVRVGSTVTLYINGSASGSTWSSSAVFSGRIFVGAEFYNNGVTADTNGYVDDFRITNGYARYWFNFQPPTRAFPNYGGTLIEANDPLFAYNTLLLSGNGTNGAQNNTFLDSSTNNFTITRNGNTTQGSFSPYGNLWSNYFDGSGDYLTVPDNAALELGSGDFTIESWVYATSFASPAFYFAKLANSSTHGPWLIILAAGGIPKFYASSSSGVWDIALGVGSIPISLNTWNHVAVTRSGTTITLWLNGQSSGTTTSSAAINDTSTAVSVGACADGSGALAGYVSNARIVKGTSLYNSAFTPSTTPLTAVTNTQLLTCQSNRFVDNSSNNFSISSFGNTSVQRFSPFEPTAPYSTSVIGGSGYFDGSGDYLSVADNAALDFGSSDFTIEGWVYLSSSGSSQTFVAKGTGADNQASYHIVFNGTNWLYFLSGNGSTWSIASGVTMGAGAVNAWQHIALVRNGSTFTPYVNGVAGTTTTSATALFDSNKILSIGADDPGNQRITGYISNLRILKGTAATITVPTAPLTAVTNTSILTNMTNAGIPDLAMMNNLETVGNAQVSTAQSKFGGSSLAFDGSGDVLSTPFNPGMNFSGDFTIECWLYMNSLASIGTVWSQNSGGTFFILHTSVSGSNALGLYIDTLGGAPAIQSSALSTGIWYHVALTRSGGVFRLFVNGNPQGTFASTGNPTPSGTPSFFIGNNNASNGAPLNGFIDDFRITNGIARYVQPFTPPTQAFQTY